MPASLPSWANPPKVITTRLETQLLSELTIATKNPASHDKRESGGFFPGGGLLCFLWQVLGGTSVSYVGVRDMWENVRVQLCPLGILSCW